MSKLSLIVCFASLSATAMARPSFVDRIPNGNHVEGVAALGHSDTNGGGALNVFGRAFQATGLEWTTELCEADSDDDGVTNGEELGDPCCTWIATAGGLPNGKETPTHPGVPNDWTENEMAARKCQGNDESDNAASKFTKATIDDEDVLLSPTTSASETSVSPTLTSSTKDDSVDEATSLFTEDSSAVDGRWSHLVVAWAACMMIAIVHAHVVM